MSSEPASEIWNDPGLSWSQLRAFQACARLSSFNAAAAFLNLTPAALRHQVGLLESRLGVRLFQRLGGRLIPTPVGAAFARQIERPVLEIGRACQAASQAASTMPLVLTAPPLFARHFLFDRRFLRWCEDNGVELDVTDARRDLFGPTQVAAIRFGAQPELDLSLTPVLEVELRLAAAPAVASQARPGDPDWWRDQILLTPSAGDQTWPRAWRALQIDHDPPAQMLRFTSYAAALEAACAGRGVILAPLPFAETEFEAGRLQVIVDVGISSRIGYALAMRRELANTPRGRALRRRLRSVVGVRPPRG